VIEKGATVGAHILSGAVMDPKALRELIPDFEQQGAPLESPVKEDHFLYLTPKLALRSPITPPPLKNHGYYIVSLNRLTAWLGEQCEAAGVNIFPEFPGADLLYDENDRVVGVRTGDKGIDKNGQAKANYELAQSFSQKAVSLDPKLDAAYLNLGATQNALGSFQAAIQTLTTALGLHGNWVIAMNELGYGYRGSGDLAHAISTYQLAVNADPKNVFGLYGLSESFFASGDKKNAKKAADQLRKVDPTVAAKLDAVLAGKIIDTTKQKVQQKIPKIPHFP